MHGPLREHPAVAGSDHRQELMLEYTSLTAGSLRDPLTVDAHAAERQTSGRAAPDLRGTSRPSALPQLDHDAVCGAPLVRDVLEAPRRCPEVDPQPARVVDDAHTQPVAAAG